MSADPGDHAPWPTSLFLPFLFCLFLFSVRKQKGPHPGGNRRDQSIPLERKCLGFITKLLRKSKHPSETKEAMGWLTISIFMAQKTEATVSCSQTTTNRQQFPRVHLKKYGKWVTKRYRKINNGILLLIQLIACELSVLWQWKEGQANQQRPKQESDRLK